MSMMAVLNVQDTVKKKSDRLHQVFHTNHASHDDRSNQALETGHSVLNVVPT